MQYVLTVAGCGEDNKDIAFLKQRLRLAGEYPLKVVVIAYSCQGGGIRSKSDGGECSALSWETFYEFCGKALCLRCAGAISAPSYFSAGLNCLGEQFSHYWYHVADCSHTPLRYRDVFFKCTMYEVLQTLSVLSLFCLFHGSLPCLALSPNYSKLYISSIRFTNLIENCYTSEMRLLSWNVNGLRAVHRNGYFKDFLKEKPDIFCLQETKASPLQLPDEVLHISGYHAYFASSRVRKGYSGVATYSSIEPKDVAYGMEIEKFDREGRLLTLHFRDFILFNVYFPNGGGGPHRLKYKLDFYDAFLEHIERLRKKGHAIIFCGDVNTAHEEIDLARPKENEENTGFLPEERAWIDEVVRLGYIDTFRYFHPHEAGAYSYWDLKTKARDRNVGWRLDYFFVSPNLGKRLKKAAILPSIFGSDHCPVFLELD
jgi:exodeoxyribonuclease-3